jgi:hypothetical protein
MLEEHLILFGDNMFPNTHLSFQTSDSQAYDQLPYWMDSILSKQEAQNYLTLSFVVQQEIEPIYREDEPQIATDEEFLSAEMTDSEGFKLGLNLRPPKEKAFIPLLNSGAPIGKHISVSRTSEKVDRVSKLLCFIINTNSNQDALKVHLEQIKRLVLKKKAEGIIQISVQALFSHTLSIFLTPVFDNAATKNFFLEMDQDLSKSLLEIEPLEAIVLKYKFYYGIKEKTITTLTFSSDKGVISRKEHEKVEQKRFTDLRSESCYFIKLN